MASVSVLRSRKKSQKSSPLANVSVLLTDVGVPCGSTLCCGFVNIIGKASLIMFKNIHFFALVKHLSNSQCTNLGT